MKTIQKTILVILLFVSYSLATMAQNLDTMPTAKRDSILISIAKEAVLKYGPDYYRDQYSPIIERNVVPPKGEINTTGEKAGKVFYWVIFPYDETEEQLEYPFAARVTIWVDTSKPSSVFFGNGFGMSIPDNVDLRSDNGEEITPMRYQQRQIIPLYDYNDPDHGSKPPLNLDELIRYHATAKERSKNDTCGNFNPTVSNCVVKQVTAMLNELTIAKQLTLSFF